jgi:Na+/proline symporter
LLRILNNYLLISVILKSVSVIIITLVGLLIRQVVRHSLKSGLSDSETETVGRIIIISLGLIVLIVGRLAGLYYQKE